MRSDIDVLHMLHKGEIGKAHLCTRESLYSGETGLIFGECTCTSSHRFSLKQSDSILKYFAILFTGFWSLYL